MSRKCIVPECPSVYRREKGKPFFTLPKKQQIRHQWMQAIQVTPDNVKKDAKICFQHFDPSDYFKFPTLHKLKPGRVPRFNLPGIVTVTANEQPAIVTEHVYIKEERHEEDNDPSASLVANVDDIVHKTSIYRRDDKWELQSGKTMDSYTTIIRWNWSFHKCAFCSFRTRFLHVILRHVKHHRPSFNCYFDSPKNYSCEECQFCTDLKVVLTWHCNKNHKKSEIHHYLRPVLDCEDCNFQTFSSLVLLRHKCSNALQISRSNNYRRDELGLFRCDHCSFKTTRKMCLKTHLLRLHTPSEQINWFKCERCSYKGKLKGDLTQHIIKVHTPSEEINWHKCERCSYKGKLKGDLTQHIIKVHTPSEEINWHKCERCSYKGKLKGDLTQHMVNVHTPLEEIKWYKCEECSHKTRNKYDLRKHIASIHNTEEAPLKLRKRDDCDVMQPLRLLRALSTGSTWPNQEPGLQSNDKLL